MRERMLTRCGAIFGFKIWRDRMVVATPVPVVEIAGGLTLQVSEIRPLQGTDFREVDAAAYSVLRQRLGQVQHQVGVRWDDQGCRII